MEIEALDITHHMHAGMYAKETRMHAGMAVIVEAEPVDDAVIGREAEQARAGIAGLRARRDAADLDESEAQPQQGIDRLGIFVEARGDADPVGKAQAECRDALARMRSRGGQRHRPERPHGETMSVLRIQAHEQRTQQGVEGADHAVRSGKTCRPSAPSGSGMTQATAATGSDA